MASLDVSQRGASDSEYQPLDASTFERLVKRDRSISSVMASLDGNPIGGIKKSDSMDPEGTDVPNSSYSTPNEVPVKYNAYHPPAKSETTSTLSPTPDLHQEIARLRQSVTELKTADRAKEVLLRSTRSDLKSARDTLTTTFAEYCAIRDEMKMTRHNITKEHQAVIYRKDIELFALRKSNEQKENYIKEHDAKLEAVYQGQRDTLELKDAQVKMLKDRLASVEKQQSPRSSQDHDHDGEEAVEVRVLRIKNGRPSLDSQAEDEKDVTITRLESELSTLKKIILDEKAEIQRAWTIAKNRQAALKSEREDHAETKSQLQDMTIELSRQSSQSSRSRTPSPARLTPIPESYHLEAMYEALQSSHQTLQTEHAALEQRLRESNARMFAAELEAKRPRPSVMHNAHFQAMEEQLTAARCALTAKDGQIKVLKSTLKNKIESMEEWRVQLDAAIRFHGEDQDEIERLAREVKELRKELGLKRTRSKAKDHVEPVVGDKSAKSSAEVNTGSKVEEPVEPVVHDESARSSGAILTETESAIEGANISALPPMPIPTHQPQLQTESTDLHRTSSIQHTPKRHLRKFSLPSLISNDAPHAALRSNHEKRRSWDLRGRGSALVKRMVTANSISEEDGNSLRRPLAAVQGAGMEDPFVTSAIPIPPIPVSASRPANSRRNTPRYYAASTTTTPPLPLDERPVTATTAKKARRGSWASWMGRPDVGSGEKEGQRERNRLRRDKRRSLL